MTAVQQDFTIYAGDDSAPIIFVNDGTAAANPIDISTATEITWTIQRAASTGIVLTYTKSGGAISLPEGGQDGRLQVAIAAADSAGLSGSYIHVTKVTDLAGKIHTTTVGSMRVGLAPTWTYDPTMTYGGNANPKDQVRALIGDTQVTDQQLYDDEILFSLAQRPLIYGAASDCCRMIASKYARQVDVVQADLRQTFSTRQRNYETRARMLDYMAATRGANLPYAGGISAMDKLNNILDSDTVQGQFSLGMFDNYLPVPPVGNVTPTPVGGGTTTFDPAFGTAP